MTNPVLYKHKTSARAAALKALGKGAEFEIAETADGRFYWIDLSTAAADAAGAENDPPAPELPVPDASPLEALPEPVAAELAATVADGPEEAAAVPEPFEEPEEKADLTIDLGLTPDLIALIYAMGEEAGEAIPVPQKRRGLTASAWEAVERGEMPEPMEFPASNSYAKLHADNLRQLTEEGNKAALEAYHIGGTNTYSKALRSYRDALLAYLAILPKMQEAA